VGLVWGSRDRFEKLAETTLDAQQPCSWLSDAGAAIEYLRDGKATGKVVLTV
jgi:hypothetical protein